MRLAAAWVAATGGALVLRMPALTGTCMHPTPACRSHRKASTPRCPTNTSNGCLALRAAAAAHQMAPQNLPLFVKTPGP